MWKHKIFVTIGDQEPIWTPPPSDTMRVDVDASVWNQNHVACGKVTRNAEGDWIMGFKKKLGYLGSTAAEILAIKNGLELSKTLGFFEIQLPKDSLDAINLLRSCSPHHPLRGEISEVRGIIYDHWEARIIYLPRTSIR
ncbi:uncharacterized protein LOC129302525 [Prosopis cineraria]|uniref:uncharacterized protein LOC129302525 n=1 Tax=Prosopis cineraria TaxID=364024 RepID=UPI0024104120|nr:uncharacterized protein LOC129302525 [Prosopis cineraria]